MKIGLFGGSFDPIHNEHIEIARNAVRELNLDKLFVIPTLIAPHKINADVSNSLDRINMLKLAFKDEAKIEVSTYEIDKEGISYSFETILYFKEKYINDEIYFLMGSDMLENFPTWKNPQIICDNATIILAERKGDKLDNDKLISIVNEKYNAKIIKLQCFGTTISSTIIRSYKRLGISLDGLVPKDVEEYILVHDLYKSNEYYEYIRNALKEKRRIHTAGVIEAGLKINKQLHLDKTKVEIACLLHDMAKYEDFSKYPNCSMPSDVPEQIKHQFVGSYLARERLGITDEDILLAINYHTTGRVGMTELEKLVFIADLIENGRVFPGVDEIRERIYSNFNEGFNFAVSELYKFLINSNEDVYYLTREAYEYYGKEQ